MKIIFDNISFSQQRAGGISVVWYEIIKRVLNDKDISSNFIEYKNGQKNIFRNLLHISPDKIIHRSQFLLKFRRYLNPVVSLNEKTIFHSTYYRTYVQKNVINITTVHDFTYEKYYHGIAKQMHRFQKYRAIKNSDIIICISENTKKDLLKYLPETNINKIRVIYNGVSDDYFNIEKPILNSLPYPSKSYMVFVGSREKYKHFDIAIDIASIYKFNFVIVGGGNLNKSESEILSSKIGTDEYKFMGSISNKQLNELYNNAFCLLYLSEYEGFGIPVIEAQKAGCPVIAFDGSSVKEIAGNTALLIKDYSLENIDDYVSILFDESKREAIINEGFKNARRFNWDKTYNQIKSLYKELYYNS